MRRGMWAQIQIQLVKIGELVVWVEIVQPMRYSYSYSHKVRATVCQNTQWQSEHSMT